MKRLKKLEKAADGYADTDQADLAEGLKDDIADTRSRVDKARESSKSRIMKKLAMGVAAAGEASGGKSDPCSDQPSKFILSLISFPFLCIPHLSCTLLHPSTSPFTCGKVIKCDPLFPTSSPPLLHSLS